MKMVIFASGSEGNSIYLEEEGKGILIDAGISRRRIIQGMMEQGIERSRVQGILVTHEHYDHIQGLKTLCKHENYPIYATEGTLTRLQWHLNKSCTHPIYLDTQIDSFHIRTVPVPHDALEPVGFVVESEKARVLVATDLGYVTDNILEEMSRCQAVVFESNHDVDMLVNGSYPPELKERILSRWGHLSNAQCSSALKKGYWEGMKLVVLAHLSKENNLPELALAEAKKVLFERTMLVTASRRNISGPFNI